MMRILFDLVHPADVLFFHNPMKILAKRGDDLVILSRHKDVTCELLDQFGYSHQPASIAGEGRMGLARELVTRELSVFQTAYRKRPHIMVGFGGVAISHIGKLLRVPAISFYAADTAKIQNRITWPFIHHLYVPEPYAGETPFGRTTRFKGVKELSYFHPENFVASKPIALMHGWESDKANFFVRTVSWRANHDIGKGGWSDDTLRALVAKLSSIGKVHISSERELPSDLSKYRYVGDKNKVHHVLANCDLYVGESATMAHEACFLGVPAIYDGPDHPGTTRELASAGMLIALKQPRAEKLLQVVNEWMTAERRKSVIRNRDKYISERPNLATFVVDAIDRHACKRSGSR
jgi:uncharacterized protein